MSTEKRTRREVELDTTQDADMNSRLIVGLLLDIRDLLSPKEEKKGEDHPMKADDWYYEDFIISDVQYAAVIRVDNTKEKVKWVNLDILKAAMDALYSKEDIHKNCPKGEMCSHPQEEVPQLPNKIDYENNWSKGSSSYDEELAFMIDRIIDYLHYQAKQKKQ